MQENLFPSEEMIFSLRRTFHTPQQEDKGHVHTEVDAPPPAVRRKTRPPLDTGRRASTRTVSACKNFIQVWSLEGL